MKDIIYKIYNQTDHLREFFEGETSYREFHINYEHIKNHIYNVIKTILENSYNFDYEFKHSEKSLTIHIVEKTENEKYYPISILNNKKGDINKEKFIINLYTYTFPDFSDYDLKMLEGN